MTGHYAPQERCALTRQCLMCRDWHSQSGLVKPNARIVSIDWTMAISEG